MGPYHSPSGTWEAGWSSPPGLVCMCIEYVMCVVCMCVCMCVWYCVRCVHACIVCVCICMLFVCTYICVIPVSLSFKPQDIKVKQLRYLTGLSQ